MYRDTRLCFFIDPVIFIVPFYFSDEQHRRTNEQNLTFAQTCALKMKILHEKLDIGNLLA